MARSRSMLRGLALGLGLLGGSVARAQEEPIFVAEQATGLVALDGHTKVDVRGFRGALLIRGGRDGELRFGGRSLDNREEERNIAVWHDGKTFLVRPAATDTGGEIFVELAVPSELRTVVEIEGGRVAASALRGGFVLRGKKIEVDLRTMASEVELEVDESDIGVDGCDQAVSVAGRALDLDLRRIQGAVTLELDASAARMSDLKGGLSAELEGTTLEAMTVAGGLEVRADGGSVQIGVLEGGGRFELTEAALKLSSSRGAIEVTTDAAVEFHDLGGPMRISGFGGNIRGVGTNGELNIDVGGGRIDLSDLGGVTKINGDGVVLSVRNNKGALTVKTTGSDIHIEQAMAPVDVDSAFGDIVVDKAYQPLRVTSRNGAVQIGGLKAALELRADGPQVEVEWLSLGDDKNSYVENESGDVRLTFAASASGRIEAEASSGIDCSLPQVQVNEDGTGASGQIGRTGRPMLRVKSGGALELGAGGAGDEGGAGG